MKLSAEQRAIVHQADAIKARARKQAKRERAPTVRPEAEGQRKPRLRDKPYLGWIRQLPCVVCAVLQQRQATPTEAAHLRTPYPEAGFRPTGMGEKPDDRRTTPLCAEHHREGPEAQHAAWERQWWSGLGIYPPGLIAFLSNAYDAGEDGEPVIARFVALARKSA